MTLTAYSADSDIRGYRVDLSWVWSGTGARPPFRVVRRRRAYPSGPDDGYAVFDTSELFASADVPWQRVSLVRYLVAGSGAEGGLVQASVAFFHDAPGESTPAVVELAVFDPDNAALAVERIDDVTSVDRTLPDPGPWGSVEAIEIQQTVGGGAPTAAGVLTVFRDHSDGTTPSGLLWEPAGGAPAGAAFDVAEVMQTRADVEVVNEREVAVGWSRVVRGDGSDLATALADPESAPDGALAEDDVLTLHEQFSEDSGDWTRSYVVFDVSAAVEETAYYTLFTQDPAAPGVWTTERGWTVRATPTARYGFPDKLYDLLPAVHRYYDEPTPEDRSRGQLRRFLQVFGAGLDHLRSSGESLRTRHDVAEARDDLLPALGAWIGWPVDLTAPLPSQRSEIRMAPDVYETVGTLPNIVALATRATSWPCQAKEFVHNLFLTNAPEEVPVRELWEMTHDGTEFGGPERLTTTPDFDGRPAAVLEPDGSTRLFWHSNRSGRWELWTRIVGGPAETEPAPLDEPSQDEPPPTFSDLSPAAIRAPGAPTDLWLFWESDREGASDVWTRVFDGAGWGKPFRITTHEAPDRRPSVAIGPGDTLWLVWESERRGSAEIWSSVYDGTVWSPALRLTEGLGQDREPAAALAADGRLWLVWRRDESGRSRLYSRVLDGGAWGDMAPLEDGPWRDESPVLARRGSDLWLLWSSDRTGRWELWGRVHDGADWADPFQITMSPDPDKEPTLLVDAGDLRVFWRSERIANEYRSRTVDTEDIHALERRGLFEDRLHYTYDTARSDVDWYALDAAGIFVTPPRGTPTAVVDDVLDRARTYLDPFCPATVRLVVIPAREPESADFFTDGIDVVDAAVDAFEDQIE
jgi:phage tail-like protein